MFSTKTSLIMANLTFKLIHFFVLLEPSFSFCKIIMYLVNLFSLSPSSPLPHDSTIRFLWILPKIIPRESKCESNLFFLLFFWIAAEYSLYVFIRSGVTELKQVWIYISYNVKLSSTVCSILYFYQQCMMLPAILHSC